MKNTIFTAILLGTFLLPSFSYAQEVKAVYLTEEAKQALILEITAKIQELITLLIAQLKVEMAQQVADSQLQTSQAITEVSNRVSTVESAVATGSVGPVIVPASATIGEMACNVDGSIGFGYSVSGDVSEWSTGAVRIDPTGTDLGFGTMFSRTSNPGSFTLGASIAPGWKTSFNNVEVTVYLGRSSSPHLNPVFTTKKAFDLRQCD